VHAYPTTSYEQTISAGYRFFKMPGTALRIALKATQDAVEEWQADAEVEADIREEEEAFAL
jgi:2-methylisocitrate lyase-like PEP mutase family enzyme